MAVRGELIYVLTPYYEYEYEYPGKSLLLFGRTLS